MSFRNQSHIMLSVLTALGLAVSVACGTGANPPPIATVEPTQTAGHVTAVTPIATVARPTVATPPTIAPTATVARPSATEAPPTVAPTATVRQPATAAPTATMAPAPAVATAPAIVSQPTRTPRPTRTPVSRAEGDMVQAVRYHHTATLLEDGRVLVTGGQTSVTSRLPQLGITSAEIYDPSTGLWSPTGPMFDPRRNHGAVLMEDGRVLVASGLTDEYELDAEAEFSWIGSIASSEVYDPSTETWSFGGDMPEEVVFLIGKQFNNKPSILLEMLENGKVLAMGGLGPSAAGLYDPSPGTWGSSGDGTSGDFGKRTFYASALLGNGKVLIIGGWDGTSQMASVELYDPLTGSSSPTGSVTGTRGGTTATILRDGKVLVSGGITPDGRGSVATSETYDPSSGTWSAAGNMTTNRKNHSLTVLSDGRVLAVGRDGSTEIYDPSTGEWSEAAETIVNRQGSTATLLKDGRVLVAGGASGTRLRPFPTTSAEVYDPVADTWTPSTEAAR